MKKFLRLLPLLAAALAIVQPLAAQDAKSAAPKKSTAPKKSAAEMEAWFQQLFTGADLSGRWAPLKDGVLGEEKSGDKYHIVSAVKDEGSNWTINARMKYRQQEFVIPIPATVQFSGDAAILRVENLTVPGGGTYSSRLLIHGQTYSGSWEGGRGGGMLYGVITNGTP